MQCMKKFAVMVCLFIVTSIIYGCGATGPKFTSTESIPSGKGIVYVYRQPSFVGGGVFGTVTANGTPITKIRNGGYFPYIAEPGKVHFEVSTEATNEADVIVKAGDEKYLKTTVGIGFFVGHLKFSEVSPEIGKKEIVECQLLEPFKE